MSRKKKMTAGRPGGRTSPPRPAPPGSEYLGEVVADLRQVIDGPCPRCLGGHAHGFNLAHVLHPSSRHDLSEKQRAASIGFLGHGFPGDTTFLACCECDWFAAAPRV